MNREALRQQIRAHEGYRVKPYKDTRGFWTVGVGHLIHNTHSNIEQTLGELLDAITDPVIHEAWFKEDLALAELAASTWIDLESLSDVRQRICVEMCFVLGGNGARKFKGFKAAVDRGDHHQAALELIDSLWHTQAPNRVNALSEQWAEG